MSAASSTIAGRRITAPAIMVRAAAAPQDQKNNDGNDQTQPDKCKDVHVACPAFPFTDDCQSLGASAPAVNLNQRSKR